ncbi:MAG: hypothetical protein ABSC91_06865 [Candidatus Bathyarchaeia archaeon]
MAPSKMMCAKTRSPMAIVVRIALTLNDPILLPADVNIIELPVQRHDVSTAADSPMRLESKFVTARLNQDNHDDLKSFQRARVECMELKDRSFATILGIE